MLHRPAQLGGVGERWLAGLSALVAELESQWSITVGDVLDGGTGSFVATATTARGDSAVLKIAIPTGEFPAVVDVAAQIDTLARAGGRGYVGLLAHDADRRAMLLEGLGPSLGRLGWSPERQIDILCRTLREAWQVPRSERSVFDPTEEKATLLGSWIEAA
ncbi:MAG: hypothetical protein M3Y91_15835 [Actinomycetota bacterium]|nr:hypothetical protein [Actinomycetota bacterium]